jgi:hypothetical protein
MYRRMDSMIEFTMKDEYRALCVEGIEIQLFHVTRILN